MISGRLLFSSLNGWAGTAESVCRPAVISDGNHCNTLILDRHLAVLIPPSRGSHLLPPSKTSENLSEVEHELDETVAFLRARNVHEFAGICAAE
jgi:hypothetical protein